jgi:hypothetical protein
LGIIIETAPVSFEEIISLFSKNNSTPMLSI